jgi:N-acetylneuraminic acid mutarotase
MIVWGGLNSGMLDTGGRYNPTTDTWTPTSTTGAPSRRGRHTVVWTGNEMIVWGGWDPYYPGLGYLNTGGRYDPLTDTWTPTSTTDAPAARREHTAVWTGSLMIVWGGHHAVFFNSGGRYDPVTDTWMPTSMIEAAAERWGHTAVWAANRMIVWGGQASAGMANTGGRYDPVTDAWTPTSWTGAPSARRLHTAMSTGSDMIVWGGIGSIDTGGRYDPAADGWTPTSTVDAPSGRMNHTAVWTGSRMIVWGGNGNTGGRYDPATDTWMPTSTAGAASARSGHTAVWSGGLMVVWGGHGNWELNNGGRYALGNWVDDDRDGLSECDGDCNDMDAGAFALPAEVTGLVFVDKQTLVWDSAAPAAGADTVHDVVLGHLTGPVVGIGEICLAAGIVEATTTDPNTPGYGKGFSYLVRGRNTCGPGTYGYQSDGTEKTSQACP